MVSGVLSKKLRLVSAATALLAASFASDALAAEPSQVPANSTGPDSSNAVGRWLVAANGVAERPVPLFPPLPNVVFIASPPVSAQTTTLESASKVADSLIRILAVFIGGAFAYWKFFKGRTFHPRLEPAVSAVARVESDTVFLTVCCKLKNVGLSSVDLDREACAIRVLLKTIELPLAKVREVKWPKRSDLTVDVFQHHEWIEGGETVEDSHLFTFPYRGDQTCRVELKVVRSRRKLRERLVEWKRRRRGPNAWSQHAVLDSFLPKRTSGENSNQLL